MDASIFRSACRNGTYHEPTFFFVVVGTTKKKPCASFLKMIAGREIKRLLSLISEPTFSPIEAHQMSPAETSGGD